MLKNLPKVFLLAFILNPASSLASPPSETYKEKCWLSAKLIETVCEIRDTRTSNGFLNTRLIKPRGFDYEFKQHWQDGRGFVSCDNASNGCYKFDYRTHKYGTIVSPWLVVKQVSWD